MESVVYSRQQLQGKVLTVTGPVSPDSLGKTLMHEHIIVDYAKNFGLPKGESSRARVGGLSLDEQLKLWEEPLSINNIGHCRGYFNQNKDNMVLDNEQMMMSEMEPYKKFGGGTIVEQSVCGMNGDPAALARISEATGVKIVHGTGYYLSRVHPPDMDNRTVQQLTEQFLQEILAGHKCYSKESPVEVAQILRSSGADLSRVVISHVDRGILTVPDMIALAKQGCVLEFDQFGWGCSFTHALSHGIDYPSDFERCRMIRELRDAGFIKQVVLSHDIAFKTRLLRYGGEGYCYLLKNIVPYMLQRGLSEEDVDTMLVQNPKRLLTIV
ncbi:PREDICTED: phosphotriesterase-related protein-like isoform X2 [Branchiostoma belcheri]|uniref:N-acetyltaurine hydrolase n=1 Tax=Branchiostoma belcheri TaxID=7741 RepID=A0A6P4ZW48_BRABE|nr:PREDICTED: phosphotriesterase-related protein-like isoform X2 [Branchiostoma belcheri]